MRYLRNNRVVPNNMLDSETPLNHHSCRHAQMPPEISDLGSASPATAGSDSYRPGESPSPAIGTPESHGSSEVEPSSSPSPPVVRGDPIPKIRVEPGSCPILGSPRQAPSPLPSPNLSPTQVQCMLCFGEYGSTRKITTTCCLKSACLKCLAEWYLFYGKDCPFCKALKKDENPEILEIQIALTENQSLWEQIQHARPSRRIHTDPLLPQINRWRPEESREPQSQTRRMSRIVVLPPQRVRIRSRTNTCKEKIIVGGIIFLVVGITVLILTILVLLGVFLIH